MKKIKKFNKIFFSIIIMFIISIIVVSNKNINQSLAEEINYIYFDLSAGNVTINDSTYTGYVYKSDKKTVQTVSGTHSKTNKYYVYQSNLSNSNLQVDEKGIPIYNDIKVNGKTWGEYITNNTDIKQVVENWNSLAVSERKVTSNYIAISGSSHFDVIIDNLWSNKNETSTGRTTGGIGYIPNAGGSAVIRMKGNNRFGNIYYQSAFTDENAAQMVFEEYENGATLTVANNSTTENSNHYNSVIGASDNTDHSIGLVFNSGIIYAGANSKEGFDDCTAIGGGGNGTGTVTINGGTITAITKSSGTAIGGGIAISSIGGVGNVTITGGTVYAYNYGIMHSGNFIPAAAIGGGSSRDKEGGVGNVTISGGKVYAQSVGGTAIGGGSSTKSYGGEGNVTISGNAEVEAISIEGTSIHAGVSIGGGTGGPSGVGNGGNAILTINGGKLTTGSIGGGNADNSTGKIGAATVKINGGTLTGQVIMSAGASAESSFTMTAGTINNKNKPEKFIFLKEDGGAVYVEEGSATITEGSIQNCIGTNGGAIYVSGGNVNIDGGIIQNCIATKGGAIYASGGNVNINGGALQNCTATNGGAVYIDGGNANIEGGKIDQCQANSGGGIYIANGNITMNGGSISSNQASVNGGGIFASSDTQDLNIKIISGEIVGNIASGHGGGVGVDMGTGLSAKVSIGLETCKGLDETHSHPVIKDNTANERGGGFCLHGDSLEMTLYCGAIDANIAIREPGSANINQTGGIVRVHGGTVNGGITVTGGAYEYIPGGSNRVGVTYHSNIQGSTPIEQAEITPGVVISLPKNVFTREGYILVGWSTVKTPTYTDIIYPAGELYTIPNQTVTLYAIWLYEGAGSIEKPSIKSGKEYEEFTGDMNVMISSDSAFSAIMSVGDMKPNLYKERTLNFGHNLKNGTTIMMVDLTNNNNRGYYYYKVDNEETNNIRLTSFKKMGGEESYVESTLEEKVDEKFIFVVDLPDDNTTINSTEMKLIRYSADEEIANIEQNVSFTTTRKREFNLNWENKPQDNKNLMLGENINLSYEPSNMNAGDSRYEGRKISLVIKGTDEIPNESRLSDGTNYYSTNSRGQFVVPLGDVTESYEVSLRLESIPLLKKEKGCVLTAELWVSADEDAENPYMGEKVKTIENIMLDAVPLPALKVEMKDRIYPISSFNGDMQLSYSTKNIGNCEVTLEIQKKNGIEYETQENVLKEVTNSTLRGSGVYSLEMNENGKVGLSLENSNLEIGTYRILIKVIEDSKIMYKIPYNFIILE